MRYANTMGGQAEPRFSSNTDVIVADWRLRQLLGVNTFTEHQLPALLSYYFKYVVDVRERYEK
jgi:hypothetical protein